MTKQSVDAKASAATFHLEQGNGYTVTVVRTRDGRHIRWAYGRWHSPADAVDARRSEWFETTKSVELAYSQEWSNTLTPGENVVLFVPGDPSH